MSADFDLQPDPRVLPMLGEIGLAQWRCLAELVDNSIDGFLGVVRAGGTVLAAEVHVRIPTADTPQATVSVTDNGPGMSAETLERAVRAGWSGNDAIGSLGMFGMGFNIATARLGLVTTVYTSRAGDEEQVGLEIDFDALRARRDFRTPRLTRPKSDPSQHGTEIVIAKLKPDQREWFSRPVNQSKVRTELARAYAAMLRSGGKPIQFRLFVNGKVLEGHRHCVWGGPGNNERAVRSASLGHDVSAFQMFDKNLGPRGYCLRCWTWVAAGETKCAACPNGGEVVQRDRRIHGWLGIQRYLSETDFGIDFLRNGRKIETANKDLFAFSGSDTDASELEYPIDDPRNRGRIVGEVHLDHGFVNYTKDRFDRHTPAWADMVRIVRGEGPLQPQKAANYPPNDSPLYLLYQLFRRSTPRSKTSGAWQRLLVVEDNDRAREMAKSFHANDPAYQNDDKWMELIAESDKALLYGKPAPGGGAPPPAPPVPGFGSGPGPTPGPTAPTPAAPTAPAPTAPGQPIASLTREYSVQHQRWEVQAFGVADNAPELAGRRPWALRNKPDGTAMYLVNRRHPVFASATLTPLDALLAELAFRAIDFHRNDPGERTFAEFFADLRERYATEMVLDPKALSNLARLRLKEIASTLAVNLQPNDAVALFKELPPEAQQRINERMATQETNAKSILAQGRFLEYAPPALICDFFGDHPELFFDGRCWDDEYSTLDYGTPSATEIAQRRLVRTYQSLLADAAWLADQDLADVNAVGRPRLLRAMHALDLLSPTTPDEEGD